MPSSHQLLHMSNRKHPDWKHYKLAWFVPFVWAQDRRALQGGIKMAQNIIGSHLPSIIDVGEVPAQSPKDIKRQYPPQSQPVHPDPIQKYPLPYYQTPEHVFFPQAMRLFNSSSVLQNEK